MIERPEWASPAEAPKQMIVRDTMGVRSIATEPIGFVPGDYDDPQGWARALWRLHVRGQHEGDVRYHAFVDGDGNVFEGRDAGLAPPVQYHSGVYLIGYDAGADVPSAETVAAVDDHIEQVAVHWTPIVGSTVARPFLSSELVDAEALMDAHHDVDAVVGEPETSSAPPEPVEKAPARARVKK